MPQTNVFLNYMEILWVFERITERTPVRGVPVMISIFSGGKTTELRLHWDDKPATETFLRDRPETNWNYEGI